MSTSDPDRFGVVYAVRYVGEGGLHVQRGTCTFLFVVFGFLITFPCFLTLFA